MIPIRNLILEGTDLSGKGSMYSEIHRITKYEYHIRDRSYLSKLCYERLYGRQERRSRDGLREELCDANNFLVVLMPPFETIIDRYHIRGDELQDEASLRQLYDIYLSEVKAIEDLPNVLVVRDVKTPEDMARDIVTSIQVYSGQTPGVFGQEIYQWPRTTPHKEVQLQVLFDLPVDHSDPEIMKHEHEGAYYEEILGGIRGIIHAETIGINPYKVPQGLDSRRFYYSSDSCISSIHFLLRDGLLKVICTLRSTDSVRNGEPDMRFLAHVSTEVARRFDWRPDAVQLLVRFNSLHIRTDVV